MKKLHVLPLLIGIWIISACGTDAATPETNVGLANPASVYCEDNGGTLEFRSDTEENVSGVCVFVDGSECDEWAFFRGECSPGVADAQAIATQVDTMNVSPTAFPTLIPLDPNRYETWWTYTNEMYGFSLLLPPDWAVEEVTNGDSLVNGHLLNLRPRDNGLLNIRMTFRHPDEDILLWPTGVGSGELIEQGTLQIAGEEARRIYFVCPTGQVQSIWYQGMDTPNILRGDVEFGFIFELKQVYCEDGYSLDGKNQHIGEMIIASLTVP